jgi:hypothetical protein
MTGTIEQFRPHGPAPMLVQVRASEGLVEVPADFVIDCTGAVHDPMRSPVFADMVRLYQLPLNRLHHLQVSNDFEVEGLRHGDAHAYAAGVLTLGGPHAAVDSFLGLQYAALRAADAMLRHRPAGLHKFNGLYSFGQWWKWATGAQP